MMTQAFYTGLSGLKNYSNGIDVVSDNIANISTIGFRAYDAEYTSLFEDALVSAGAAGDDASVGVGVRMQATSMRTLQGSLQLSDRSTDIAILGKGWFGVTDEFGRTLYTRDGSFNINPDADLVTNDGMYVLGTMGGNISADNVLTKVLTEVKLSDITKQEKLRFPKTLTYPPEPSTKAKFLANLGVGYEPITVGASVVDPQNNKNHLRLEFTKKAVQTPPGTQYDVKATTQSLDGKTIYDTKYGEAFFDASGALISHTMTTIDNNGAPVQIDLGSGYDGIISIDIPVVPGSSLADGTIGGELQGYSINQNGEVVATFTNGRQSSVGKIAVYHFGNEQGLTRVSGTRFAQSENSGKAFFVKNAAGEFVTGTNIQNFRLEGSNYDMTSGLTELIILQRAYDANSKSVTTADQMIQKALNMDA